MAKKKNKVGGISRRKFLKGASIAAGGVAALGITGVLAGCTKEKVELEVADPTGAIEVTELHAPRIDTLAGKTICELSVGLWEPDRTFPLLRELLQNQFPTATFIPFTEFPEGSRNIVKQEARDAIGAAGCDAVIVGNAG